MVFKRKRAKESFSYLIITIITIHAKLAIIAIASFYSTTINTLNFICAIFYNPFNSNPTVNVWSE